MYFIFTVITGFSGLILATIIRIELAYAGQGILCGNAEKYLTIISLHGVVMVFFVVIPILFGAFGNFLLPTQLGIRDVAFPRLNSFMFWITPAGFVLLLHILLFDKSYNLTYWLNYSELKAQLRRRHQLVSTSDVEFREEVSKTLLAQRLAFFSDTSASQRSWLISAEAPRSLLAAGEWLGMLRQNFFLQMTPASLSSIIRGILLLLSDFFAWLNSSIAYILFSTYAGLGDVLAALRNSEVPAAALNMGNFLSATNVGLLDYWTFFLCNITSIPDDLTTSCDSAKLLFAVIPTSEKNQLSFPPFLPDTLMPGGVDLLWRRIFFQFQDFSFINFLRHMTQSKTLFGLNLVYLQVEQLFSSNAFSSIAVLAQPIIKLGNYYLWWRLTSFSLYTNNAAYTQFVETSTAHSRISSVFNASASESLVSTSGLFYHNSYATAPAAAHLGFLNVGLYHPSYRSFNLNSRLYLQQYYSSLLAFDYLNDWRTLKLERELWRSIDNLSTARKHWLLRKRYYANFHAPATLINKVSIWLPNHLIPGWAFITPYSSRLRYTALGKVDIALIVVLLASVGSVFSSINYVITYRYIGAPTLKNRKELRSFYVDALLVGSRMMIVANPALITGILLLLSDRHFGTSVFDFSGGGDTILFQHLFWFFGHPEVYIVIIPCFGFMNSLLPYYLRKRLSGRLSLQFSMYTIAFMSFAVWGHHMYMVGLANSVRTLYSTGTVMISVPASTKILHWCVTLIQSSLSCDVGFLFLLAFMYFFVLGGLSGMFVAHLGFDVIFHDTFYVIGHFHVMFACAAMCTIFAGFYFYFAAIFGVRYSRFFAYLHFFFFFCDWAINYYYTHDVGRLCWYAAPYYGLSRCFCRLT